jgi:hypothetical protein
MSDDIILAAAEYAERGWHVFPVHGLRDDGQCDCGRVNCPNAAKHPCIKSWPEEATTDVERVITWWGDEFPTANVGIVTGNASHLAVLDVDDSDVLGGWSSKTLTAKTPRGFHFYFQPNGMPARSNAGKLGPKLDVRGEGGYVVAPPSVHASHNHYFWVNPGASLEIVPHWLLASNPIPNGQRNETLFKIAAAMHGRGESDNAILEELLRVNEERCAPPLARIEVQQIKDSITRYQDKIVVVSLAEPKQQSISFPQLSITGSIGELARTLARGTEVPEEFYFASGLTVFGSRCAGRLRVAANVDCEPRLYTVLLGASYEVKKSTAMKRTVGHLLKQSTLVAPDVKTLDGVGSAEGLARKLNEHKHVLLCYDEMRALMDKASIQGAVLLPTVTSLYEGTRLSNPTKNPKQSIEVDDGHLSLLGCCTLETYSRMWTSDAIAIGLPNRLFIVSADRRRKVAWPENADQTQVDAITARIERQLAQLPPRGSTPLLLNISDEAKARWTEWYESAPPSEHAKRLDTIGFRLMPLLAITNDKTIIDSEVMDTLLAILDYEVKIRQLTDPIDADNAIAAMEEKIRRVLSAKGPRKPRELRRDTHANRAGLWIFDTAITNLKSAARICQDKATAAFVLIDEEDE